MAVPTPDGRPAGHRDGRLDSYMMATAVGHGRRDGYCDGSRDRCLDGV